jgi:CheY-like chemotaxis protein
MRMEEPEPGRPRISDTALIVEDCAIIAMAAEEILLDLGARQVDIATSVDQALRAIARTRPSFALLDLNLGHESSIGVAHKLTEIGVPFIFATGYGERAPIPAELASAPVIQKPYTLELVEKALGKLARAIV